MSAFATTKHLLYAVVATMLTFSLTGCGADTQDADTTAAESKLMPPGEGKTEYPLTLESPFGTTTLTKRPERIAVISAGTMDTDALLALDVVPVFAPSTVDRTSGWTDSAQIEQIETLWDSAAGAETSAEEVSAAKPDLIVTLSAYEFDQARFEQLTKIAPVLYSAFSDDIDPEEALRAVAEPLDLADAAQKRIAAYEQSLEELRAENPDFNGKSASFIVVYAAKYGVTYDSIPGSPSAALLADLGFVPPPSIDQVGEDGSVNLEDPGVIDADFLLLSANKEDAAYFFDSPVTQAVPAIADGRAAVVDPTAPEGNLPWALASASVLSLQWAATRVADLAAETLDT